MGRKTWMPIRLEPANPDDNYPGEVLKSWGARAWGDLLWKFFDWDAGLPYDREANSYTFVSDNFGRLIPAHICLGVAAEIERHLNEFTDPEEREYWAAQIPYWRHCGGFFHRGKREAFS